MPSHVPALAGMLASEELATPTEPLSPPGPGLRVVAACVASASDRAARAARRPAGGRRRQRIDARPARLHATVTARGCGAH
eukprot:364562-Chlamydomonas_euryale.AAC.10